MDARGRTGERRGIPHASEYVLVRALYESQSADLRVTVRLTDEVKVAAGAKLTGRTCVKDG